MFNIILFIICILSLNSCQNKNVNKEVKLIKRVKYRCPSPDEEYVEKYDWFANLDEFLYDDVFDDNDVRFTFPGWLYEDVIKCYNFNEGFDLFASRYLNPYFVYGDFNGDCSIDVAFFARNRNDNEIKLCIIHQNTKSIILLDKGTKDYSWVDNIDVLPHNVGFSGAHSCIELQGDALWIGKYGTGAGGWIYWNGNDYNFVHGEAGMGIGLEEKKDCVDSTDITENIGYVFR